MKQRPFAITVLGWLYAVVGAVALGAQVKTLGAPRFYSEGIWITLIDLLAIVAGIFMLRGYNWARWLAVAWIAFHVVVGFLNGYQQLVFHAIVFTGITFLLFRADARAWFRGNAEVGG